MWRDGTWVTLLPSELHGTNFVPLDTHATQACRKYEKFVKDNPIVSSRRNAPVQVQGQRATVNTQEPTQRPLFRHPPMQRFNLTVIPHMATNTLDPQGKEHDFKEHSRKSPQNQMKEVRTSDAKTTSSPKELSGHSHGSTLSETSTVCRD